MSDRYTYLPSIGLLILLVWSAGEFLAARKIQPLFAAITGGTALCACLITSSRQLPHWQSSVALFRHAVEVTHNNYVANAYLGGALEAAGLPDDAVPFYRESVRITPHFPIAQWALGKALLRQGHADEAAEHLLAAARLVPHDAVIHCYAGKACAAAGNFEEAAAQFREALRLHPGYPDAANDLNTLLAAHPGLK